MAGSGVYRLRNSRKNHPIPIEDNPQRKGRYTGAPVIGEVLKAPKKSDAHFRTFPTTKPPVSNDQPIRGEGPTRNVTTKGSK